MQVHSSHLTAPEPMCLPIMTHCDTEADILYLFIYLFLFLAWRKIYMTWRVTDIHMFKGPCFDPMKSPFRGVGVT